MHSSKFARPTYRIPFLLLAIAVTACGPVQRPTPTPPRPTQAALATAIPPATATATQTSTSTATPPPTNTPRPTTRATFTRTPTRRLTVPATAAPASPSATAAASTATPTPTTPAYRYRSANKGCEHSGQTFIQGTIYRGSDRVNGVTVGMSGAPDGQIVAQRVSGTDGDGFYSIIVNASGASPGQSRWVWIVESGKRASDIVQFDFNNLKTGDPAACWRGFVDFVQQY